MTPRKPWADLTDEEQQAAIRSLSGRHVKGGPASSWERSRAQEEAELADVQANYDRAIAERARRRAEEHGEP